MDKVLTKTTTSSTNTSADSHIFASQAEIQKIIATYSIIYKIFFGFGKYIVAILMSVILGYNLITSAYNQQDTTRNDTFIAQENELTKQYQQLLDREQQNKQTDVRIQQGSFLYTGNTLLSVDNFITYRDFVFPRKINVNKNIPLQDKTYFDNPNYNIDELQLFMDNFIYTNNENLPQNSINNILLTPTTSTLQEFFTLSCIQGTLIFTNICDEYLQQFLQVLYVYDMSAHYDELATIFNNIKTDNTKKQQFCQSLDRYVQYSNDNNGKLLPIMAECGETYRESFNAFSQFISIQEQLKNNILNSQTSDNRDLNAYKLLSAQQAIVRDIQTKKFTPSTIQSYIRYVEELLRKDAIDPVYIDAIYLYNNNYLEKNLVKNFFNLQGDTSDSIKKILEGIRTLNRGSNLLGYAGLNKQIHNVAILDQKNSIKIVEKQENTGSNKESSLEYFERIYGFDGFTIEQQQALDNQKIQLIGTLRYNPEQITQIPRKIDATIIIEEQEGLFIVTNFASEDSSIQTFVRQTIRNNKYTIAQLHDLIKQSEIIIYQGVQAIDVCNRILADTTLRKKITNCSDDNITLTTSHPRKANKTITHTFEHNQGILTQWATDDPQATAIIKETIPSTTINSATITSFLLQVSNYTTSDPDERTINVGGAINDKIHIEKQLQEFLGVTTNNILEKEGNFLAEITINNITLLVGYDIERDVLGPLIIRGKNNYLFETFSIELDSSNIDQIDNFLENPQAFLKKLDTGIYERYESE